MQPLSMSLGVLDVAPHGAMLTRPTMAPVPLVPVRRRPSRSLVVAAVRTSSGAPQSARRLELEAQTRVELEAHASWWADSAEANVASVRTPQELKAAVTSADAGQLVVVEYFAPNCHACRALFPKLKAMAAARQDIRFVQANVASEEMRALCVGMGIRSIPWFHIFRAGDLLAGFTANISTLPRLRDEVRRLDVATATAPVAPEASGAAADAVAALSDALSEAIPTALTGAIADTLRGAVVGTVGLA